MGIRMPKYFRTWQGFFSSDPASSSKAKDLHHATNGRPHRARAQSQSNEPSRGEQDDAPETRLNPEPPEPVQPPKPPAVVRHSGEVQQSPEVVRQSQVEIQEPPTEVQQDTQHSKPPVTARHPPEEVQHPISPPVVQPSPKEIEHSPEPVAIDASQKGPVVQPSRKHSGPDETPGDDRDRQIIRLKQELAESARVSSAHFQQYQQLQETLKQQKINITELTETILRTVHSRTETVRDDDYFEVEFARLANSIHQWVFRYFNLVSEIKHAALPPIVKECLNNTIFEYSKLQDHRVKRKEVEAAISERIYSCIFRNPFLFGKNGIGYRAVRSILAGTELEKRNWEVQTVSLAMKSDNYNDQLRETILSIAKDLHHEFDSLAKDDSGEYRHKALYAILEQAARLRIETARQVSPIRLPKIVPGSQFNSSTMEDRLSAADEDDDEDGTELREFSVQMVLVPPVKRRVFDEDGNFVKSIIIRKGTVIAMQSDGAQVAS